jgi:cystathionine gamma-synthase
MKIETECVLGDNNLNSKTGAVSFPIYQTATFKHLGLNQSTGYDYSRTLNPTREKLEKTIAILENGTAGFAFSTGMAAISAVLELFSPGDEIIVTDDLYGGTYRIFEEIYGKKGYVFRYADTRNIKNIESVINKKTKAVFLETPSNPMMKVSDITEIAGLSRKNNLLTIVDNTFLSPYFQKPLELGADIVVHSGTKFLGGHNDALSGLVVVKDKILSEKIGFIQNSVGAVLSPFDSWLILRGIKTLAIRLERQEKNAFEIVKFLNNHKEVEKVYFAGLPEHEGFEISKKQSSGFGAMISFTVKNRSTVEKLLNGVKIISFAESLGGVESLITYPYIQTHQAIPEDIRKRLGITDKLLRLSIGIENVLDLIGDLKNSLE